MNAGSTSRQNTPGTMMRELCRYSSIARLRLAHTLPRGHNLLIPSGVTRGPAQTLSSDTRPASRVNLTLRTGKKYMVCRYFPEPMRPDSPGGASAAAEDARLDPRRHPAGQPARHRSGRVERHSVAWPVLEQERSVDVVQETVHHDGRQEEIVQVADERDEVGDQVHGTRQVQGDRPERDLRRERDLAVAEQGRDHPREPR